MGDKHFDRFMHSALRRDSEQLKAVAVSHRLTFSGARLLLRLYPAAAPVRTESDYGIHVY
ncbi:MAG: hypothetical protein E2O37_05455 [Proteobacteria bacterium]|nr:MAG: hypothetical protein E2O37_05455 [Pseudomonadota bacterium]TDJ72292.1 MAG: hypothetical protein E2O38_05080 [Pseudomonadota bacterium]